MTLTTTLASSDAAAFDEPVVAAAPVPERIRLSEPLPGFPSLMDWTLDGIDPGGVLWSLRSVDEPGLRFVVTPCHAFFPDYDTGFAAAVAASLRADEVEVLLMLTVGASLETATANLRAPLVLAPAVGRAVQVVLDDRSLSMRQPLVATGV